MTPTVARSLSTSSPRPVGPFDRPRPRTKRLRCFCRSPDVLLLVISMPDMDGFELLAMIRGVSRLREIPAIAVTAHAYAADRNRCLEAGFAETRDDRRAAVVLIRRSVSRAWDRRQAVTEARVGRGPSGSHAGWLPRTPHALPRGSRTTMGRPLTGWCGANLGFGCHAPGRSLSPRRGNK
jgi:CheY-like chemotaxis protein